MRIIQNFSSGKHIKTLPVTDILIWYVGLLSLKQDNHILKLYCKESDVPFLKKWGLFELYDEFDFETLETFVPTIDETNFWSVRKLECIRHEFEVSTETFIYMDTDIIMQAPISFDKDVIVWSPETKSLVYLPWVDFSFPPNYKLPEWLATTDTAYNCGILGFKQKQVFDQYLAEYYNFTTNNPCKLYNLKLNRPDELRCIWACNAEQRILKGLCSYLNLAINYIMDTPEVGISPQGIHFYILRHNWRRIALLTELKQTDLLKPTVELLNKYLLNLLENLPPEALKLFTTNSIDLYNLYYYSSKVLTYI